MVSWKGMAVAWIGLSCSLLQGGEPLLLRELSDQWEGKEVEVRGFVYANQEGQELLADTPGLKSCCVGSEKNRAKQLWVRWEGEKPAPSLRAVTVKGTFHKEKNGEELLYMELKEAELLKEKSRSWKEGALGGGALVCLLSFFLWGKGRKKKAKQ